MFPWYPSIKQDYYFLILGIHHVVHKDIHGVIWVDDSKATNVEATYAGLMGLKGQKSVILLGGLAKVRYSSFPLNIILFITALVPSLWCLLLYH